MKQPRFHYAWVIVAAGTLAVVACLGFGRFALGMLLPSMASTLDLSYSQLGYVSTGNFVGYLAAVLGCGPVVARVGARRTIVAALVLMSASMFLISRAHAFAQVLVLYTLTGLGSGAANVPVMGLVARWFSSRLRGRAAGFVVSGSGLAIVTSGWLIPFVNRVRGPEGWRTSWLVLALAVLAIASVALVLLRDEPRDRGLEPLGGAPGVARTAPPVSGHRDSPAPHAPALYVLGAVYFLFGASYVVYATFIVTTLVRERGLPEAVAGTLWSVIGALSLASGPVFGALSDRMGRKAGLVVAFSIQAVAYALVAAPLPNPAIHVSVACFGLVAWAVPSIMLAAVSDHVGPDRAVAAFGLVTFAFGLGQIAGPSAAGVLAQRTGTFASSFALAAVLAVAAIVLSGLLGAPAARTVGSSAGADPGLADGR